MVMRRRLGWPRVLVFTGLLLLAACTQPQATPTPQPTASPTAVQAVPTATQPPTLEPTPIGPAPTPPATPATEPLAFSGYVVLGRGNSRFRGGEPSLNIGKSGTLWSTNIGPPQIWKSVDRGETWVHIEPPIRIGGADMDAAEDDAGRLHVADQTGTDCIFYSRSTDGGRSFDIVRGTHGEGVWFDGQGDCQTRYGVGVDKPWIATWGSDTIYIVYGDRGLTAIDYSYDGGSTFAHTEITFAQARGMAVDLLDGSLYLVNYSGGRFVPEMGAQVEHKIGVAHSPDGGKTFAASLVVDRGTFDVLAGGFPSIAVDRAHNVYVAWGDDSSGKVELYLSVSKDRGKTWRSPQKITGNQTVSIYPTIAAGDAGRIAIAWYGTADPAKSRYNAPNTLWYVYAVVSLNALEEEPTFAEARVSREPFHRNSICAHVNICEGVDVTTGQRPPGYEGGIADFFRMALDGEGLLNVVWTDTAHYKDAPKDHFARQVSGPRLVSLRE